MIAFPIDDGILDWSEIEVAMAERIPSNVFIMRAVPAASGKFHALYSAPGLIPAIAETRDGRPYEYDTELEAEHGAARSLFGILNGPRIKARQSGGKPERYQKLTGPEFAVLLQRAGITPSFMAYLFGTSQQRVIGWIDGVDSVPHPARLLLELFIEYPQAIDLAERVTDSITTERRPKEETR